MNLKFTPFILIIFIALFSCSKIEFYDRANNDALLKQVWIGGEIYQEFTFTDAGFIEEEKSKYHYSRYSYNGKNELIQSEHYWDERVVSSSSYVLDELAKETEWISPDNSEKDVVTDYEYDRYGKLKKKITHRLNNDVTSTTTFIYKRDRIEKRVFENETSPETFDLYFYDSVGNLTKKERYYGSELQTTTEYEFDIHPNPYYSFRKLLMPGKHTNPNNIVKETYTLHFEVDAFIDKVQISEYDYTYNSHGYPISSNDLWEYIYY